YFDRDARDVIPRDGLVAIGLPRLHVEDQSSIFLRGHDQSPCCASVPSLYRVVEVGEAASPLYLEGAERGENHAGIANGEVHSCRTVATTARSRWACVHRPRAKRRHPTGPSSGGAILVRLRRFACDRRS